MTIKSLYPTQRPVSIYNAMNAPTALPVNATLTRNSTASFTNEEGRVEYVAANEPRYRYDIVSRDCEGLLLEPKTENEVKNSEGNFETNGSGDWTTESITAPDGDATSEKWTPKSSSARNQAVLARVSSVPSNLISFSVFAKKADLQYVFISVLGSNNQYGVLFDIDTGEVADTHQYPDNSITELFTPYSEKLADGWWRFSVGRRRNSGEQDFKACVGVTDTIPSSYPYGQINYAADGTSGNYFWGAQFEQNVAVSSYIPTNGQEEEREADVLSIKTDKNFDMGYSLLFDSQSVNVDYIYKLKKNGVADPVAYLQNDNGTLKWDVNGESAQKNGDYPQVGFKNRRTRTVSTFGEAGVVGTNYLYTTGLSFPTEAAPATEVNELVVENWQVLKALYVWRTQLDDISAVSLINGKYNIVSSEPIAADAYSFIYDITTANLDNVFIDLPYLNPTVSMEVDWGDGIKSTSLNGEIASHTYPYPGVYRIQIEADDGFDSVRLGLGGNTQTNGPVQVIEQWAPQHRVGATGPGFTGDEMVNLLNVEKQVSSIPDFKYDTSGITSLESVFTFCTNLDVNNWSIVPTQLPNCTNLKSAFSNLGNKVTTDAEKASFPTLTTSDKLTDVRFAWKTMNLTGFENKTPVTDSSAVTTWIQAFNQNKLTELDVDTSAAENMQLCFASNDWVTSPFFEADNCTNWQGLFSGCKKMTAMDAGINVNTFSNGTNFDTAWSQCNKLETFPQINTSSAENLKQTWWKCSSLNNIAGGQQTSFPLINTENVTDMSLTWQGCSSLVNFPEINVGKVTTASQTWLECSGLTSFPALDFKVNTIFTSTWSECSSLESFPLIKVPKGDKFDAAWKDCTSLKSFPLIDFPEATRFGDCWYGCSALESFPLLVIAKANNLNRTWYLCDSITSFPAIQFPAGQAFTGTWKQCQSLTEFPSTISFPEGTTFSGTWNNCRFTSFPPTKYPKATSMPNAWASNPNLATFPSDNSQNVFNSMGTLLSNAFGDAWAGCALTAQSIENILVSLDANGSSNIDLGIQGGTNADKSTWTANAITAYDNLISKGWDIDINDSGRSAAFTTSDYYVNHQDDAISFGQFEPGVVHVSGKANQESFETEAAAINRVLELDENFFPTWQRTEFYEIGDRVKFGDSIYRSLQVNDPRSFELPDPELEPDVEIPTPANRQARWAEVFDPQGQDIEPVAALTVDDQPRKRARNEDGTYKGNDPNTPENEAWER